MRYDPNHVPAALFLSSIFTYYIKVYVKLQDEHNIPAADFPDVDMMRVKLKK